MSMAGWPPSERPRERMLAHGPAALSDAELVALFLGTGVRGQSALEVARALLSRFGRLSRLLSAAQRELHSLPGLGPFRAAQIAAVMELARRALAEEMKSRDSLRSPAAAASPSASMDQPADCTLLATADWCASVAAWPVAIVVSAAGPFARSAAPTITFFESVDQLLTASTESDPTRPPSQLPCRIPSTSPVR